MKAKQKSFITNNSKKLSSYRPNSSTKTNRFLGNNKNYSLSEFYPPITYTMPSQKKASRMGKQITKEELYEENIHLKEKLNKMRKELDETKNKLFKQSLELNKKDKIIRDCNKENVTELTHEINLEKAKESALLTMCKNKYIEMKKNYDKKCEENNILKANIKLTKLKEYQIQIDILKKEMEKLRNLYTNSQTNYENSLIEIQKMQTIKNEFMQQHSIINTLNQKYQDLYNQMNFIQKENDFLKNELSKNQEIKKKLKKNYLKLKISNKKYLNLKKQKENSIIVNNDNIRQLQHLKKDLAEYKLLYTKQSEKYKNLLKNKEFSKVANKNILDLKPFNYENVKNIENIQSTSNNQTQLYKSLLEEAKIKNSIFENFLREHDINPEQIIKSKGYDGIMNLNTNKTMLKLTQKFGKTSTNNSTNSKDGTSVGTKENPDLSKNLNYTQSNIENNLIYNNNTNVNKTNNIINNEINNEINNDINNNNTNNNNEIKEGQNINMYIKQKEKENKNEIKDIDIEENKDNNNLVTENNNYITENQETNKLTQSQNSDFNTQEQQAKETQLLAILHTFVKNLEANHITKEFLINKIKEISVLFENREEATKEEFIEPFINLFLESMKVTQSNDIQLINEFFSNFIDDMEGDTNRFFLELIDIFENIVDYTLVENEEEVLNAISMELQPYKEELKLKLQKNDNNIITFDNLRKVIEELNINLTDDYTEFLIYKMKEKVPEKSSIFDLNYKIIIDLLDRNINSNLDNNLNNNANKEENLDKKETEEKDDKKVKEERVEKEEEEDKKVKEEKVEKEVKEEKEEKKKEEKEEKKEKEEKVEKEEKEEEKDEENENGSESNEDEMNIHMSNKLSELKQVLKDNNTSLGEECKDQIKIVENQNNKKINGINKDIFFGIMQKYNIEIEDKVKEAIFDLFKLDSDTLINSQSELFLLDYDKLCNILEFEDDNN